MGTKTTGQFSLAAWGCASDFLNIYQNSKWSPEVTSKFFCGRKNCKTLEILQIPLLLIPQKGDFLGFTEIQNGNVQVILMQFQMATTSHH